MVAKLDVAGIRRRRPDIVIERSIRDSVDRLREELKTLGDSDCYVRSLRVLATQAGIVRELAGELLDRAEKFSREEA